MAFIITSKTRSRIMSQPREAQKFMADRRAVSREKHGVEKVNPLKNFTELEIHEELDNQGSGIKESMLANQEVENANLKLKKAAQKPHREKVIKERIEKLEARDKKSGKLDAGKKFQAESKKRRKK